MIQVLEDARKLAHGTYDDVIVVEHRKPPAPRPDEAQDGSPALQVVLEMPEGSRVIHAAKQYQIDGVLGDAAPRVGGSYRLVVGPSLSHADAPEASAASTLRYETMNR